MATVAPVDSNWRDVMTREDRINMCQHIMQQLGNYYPGAPEQTLREKTSVLETQAYMHAESRTDYLHRVAGGLSNVQRQVMSNPNTTDGTSSSNGGRQNNESTISETGLVVDSPSWRDEMTREDRIDMCQHIMSKLDCYYSSVPGQRLKEKTSVLESEAFTHAQNRNDYMRRIIAGLQHIEQQVMSNPVIHGVQTNIAESSRGEPQNNQGTMNAPAQQAQVDSSSWRDSMSREDRIDMCQHIMSKLDTFYPSVQEQRLKEKTSALESEAFTHAQNRSDYVHRIAAGLQNIERQVTANPVFLPVHTNTSGTSGGTGNNPGGITYAPPGANVDVALQGRNHNV